MKRGKESGISLLNVLVVVAAGAGLVQIMLSGQETALERLAETNDLAQARSLAQSGVTSVAVALRRDLIESPDTDHFREPWALSRQEAIALEAGRFEISLEDARGRFDLNALSAGSLVETRVFSALLAVLDMPQSLAPQIARIIANEGPLASPTDLISRGLSEADVKKLAPHVTALEQRHPINLNTASEPVLAALFGNPAAARGLMGRRVAKGYLDRSDLAALGLLTPPLAGFTSDAFEVTVTAESGRARSVLKRRLLRDRDTGQVIDTAGD